PAPTACRPPPPRTAAPPASRGAPTPPPSPYRFQLRPGSPDDFFLEDDGYELAVFHSHPTDKAEPSRTDIENIGLWEGKPYFILSRPTGELRGWRIAEGRVQELEIG